MDSGAYLLAYELAAPSLALLTLAPAGWLRLARARRAGSLSRPLSGAGSDEVVALFDVLDEAGMGGLPAQEFLGDGAGGGHVGAEQAHEHALVLAGGARIGPHGPVAAAWPAA